MSDAAIINAVSRGVMATLVDGTVRIKLDIEPADAAKAFAMMGMPGSPVVVASISIGTPPPASSNAAPHTDATPKQIGLAGGPLARLAGMWCGDPDFADWLADEHGVMFNGALADADGDIGRAATSVLRALCGIESRIELDHDDDAAGRFQTRIRQPFMAHRERAAA